MLKINALKYEPFPLLELCGFDHQKMTDQYSIYTREANKVNVKNRWPSVSLCLSLQLYHNPVILWFSSMYKNVTRLK